MERVVECGRNVLEVHYILAWIWPYATPCNTRKRILKQNITEVFKGFHKLARVKVVLIRQPGDSGRERMALFAQQVCTHVFGTCCTCCMPQRLPFCQPGSLPISTSREPNNAAKSGPGFSWCDISLSTTYKTHTLWEPEPFQRHVCVGRGSSLELSQHLPETHLAALQVENTLGIAFRWCWVFWLQALVSQKVPGGWQVHGGKGERTRVLFHLCLKKILCVMSSDNSQSTLRALLQSTSVALGICVHYFCLCCDQTP